MSLVNCNEMQTETLLKKYFKREPIVTSITSDKKEYYIKTLSIPSFVSGEWVYKNWNNNLTGKKIRVSHGRLQKGDRQYDVSFREPSELTAPLNRACEKAIQNYENANDLFLNEETRIVKVYLRHPVTKGFVLGIFFTALLYWLFS